MITIVYSIIAAGIFYLLPVLLGRGTYGLINFYTLARNKKSISLPKTFVNYFVIGSLIVFATALFVNYVVMLIVKNSNFIELFADSLIIVSVIGVIGNFVLQPNIKSLKNINVLIASVFLGGLGYLLWQLHSPYPFNWDIYEHQTLINNIFRGEYSFFPTHITDTFGFNSYSSLFQTLIATSQLLAPIEFFSYWHAISLIHFVSVIFVSYFLVYEITDDKIISTISTLLAAFIFDSNSTFTSLFLLPQTLAAVVFIFALWQFIVQVKSGKLPSILTVSLICIFLILCHYIVGFIAAVLYLAVYLYFRNHQFILFHLKKIPLFIGIGLVLAFLIVFFSHNLNLNFLNQGEAASFNFSLFQKYNIMRQAYGYFFAIFIPIGIVLIIKRKKELEIGGLIIMLFLLLLVLVQLPYVIKFYVLTRYFVHLVLAIGLGSLLKQIKNPPLYSLSFYIIIIFLTSIFIVNAATWKQLLEYNNIFTQIAPNEIKAAYFLETNYAGQDVLLVSDPATQHLLEPLSLVNTQGGAYMDKKTRILLNKISLSDNPSQVVSNLYQINDKLSPSTGKRLFVLSGRYFSWQKNSIKNKQSLAYNIWYPEDLTFADKKTIALLSSEPAHFSLIYQNPTVAIFEVKK